MEMEKQMLGKQMFAAPYRNNETQRGILTNRLCYVPSSLPQLVHIILYLSLVIDNYPGTGPLSNFF